MILSDGTSTLSGTADVNSFNKAAAPPAATPSIGATLGGSFTVDPTGDGRFLLNVTITPATGQPTPEFTTVHPACYIVDANTPLAPGVGCNRPRHRAACNFSSPASENVEAIQ